MTTRYLSALVAAVALVACAPAQPAGEPVSERAPALRSDEVFIAVLDDFGTDNDVDLHPGRSTEEPARDEVLGALVEAAPAAEAEVEVAPEAGPETTTTRGLRVTSDPD